MVISHSYVKLPEGKLPFLKNSGTRPGKRLRSYRKIHHFSMGKSTISMVIFNSYVKLPEGKYFWAQRFAILISI